MYKVICYFTDLHDNNRPYNVGDVFPRDGVTVTATRLVELSGCGNKQGRPLIALVEETEAEQKTEPETECKKPKKANEKKKTAPGK